MCGNREAELDKSLHNGQVQDGKQQEGWHYDGLNSVNK